MIDPFLERSTIFGLSYGLSPAGYDIRLGEDLIICPQEMKLGVSLEKFIIPNDILGVVHDKSTWARKGLFVQNTIIEPGWRGFLTLEISREIFSGRMNLCKGTPIAQIIFHRLEHPTNMLYDGKYQDQGPKPQKALEEWTK